MTRVLHSLPLWLPLTSPWLYNQVRYLPEDIETAVFAERTDNLDVFGYEPLVTPQGRAIVDRGLRKLGVRTYLGAMVREAKRREAQIVHSHWGDWGWRDHEGVRRAGAKHVVTFYGKDVNYLPQQPVWRERYADYLAAVDLVLCEGPFMAQEIVGLGLPADRVRVQHLGVEAHEFPFRPRRYEPGTPLRALIAASFREKKGIPYAIEALGRLDVPVELTIIGDASDDPRSHPEKEAILAALDATGLRERTRLLGYQPHAVMLEEAYASHVFLSPSVTAADGDTEGGAPVSLIEMAATGMPLIATTHCDIPEVVVEGETGWLAPERDVDALVAVLRRWLDTPDWEPMLAAGRAHIDREYDVREQARRLAEIYKALV